MLLKFAREQYYRTALQLLTIVFATWLTPALAENKIESLQLHGFVNQGYFLSSDNNIFGNSSDHHGSFQLTEIGLNASIQPFSNIGLAIQGIYRRSGEVSDEGRLDYALIDWTAIEHEDYQFGLRLGRIKSPIGFFNETRDVAFTRPSIFLPQGIYKERSHDLFLSSDGAQLYFNHFAPIGEFSLLLNSGKLDGDDTKETLAAILGSNATGHMTVKPTKMGKLSYESNSGATRLSISYTDVEMDYKPGAVDPFHKGDLSFNLLILSAQQRFNNLTITIEHLHQKQHFENLGPFFPDYKTTSESYYIQGDYHFSHQLQGTLRYDASFSSKDDKEGKDFTARTGLPSHLAYSKGYMAGLRWSPSSNWLLQAEYHLIEGVSTLSFSDNPDLFNTKKHWNLFALQLSYRF